jgi:hypothetical protein
LGFFGHIVFSTKKQNRQARETNQVSSQEVQLRRPRQATGQAHQIQDFAE